MKSTWTKNPLLHFGAIGAVLFALSSFFRGGTEDDSRRIEIDQKRVEGIRELFAAQWKRPPTESELGHLIDRYIDEEVLYREAVALGLDQGDTVVRLRLAQKLELLADDLAMRAEPNDAELEAYLRDHLDRYELPPKVSFSHVYFSRDRLRADAEPAARRALDALTAGADPRELGDTAALPPDYASRTPREVSELFGAEFAAQLFELAPGAWSGPLSSSYGVHLVLVRARTEPVTPELADVSKDVRNDLLAERRREANETLLDTLKERYEIVVEGR